uniref:Uncharacterized protein n=1 Tax=Ananas comosus var. bracteatus TaxID=296719 RepID=A0A6V7NPQ0_ANACO|nr:unnamed protein product [Ananas comosus var. bracteatus]
MAQATMAKGLEAKPLLSPPDLCGAPRAMVRRSSSSLSLRPRSKVGVPELRGSSAMAEEGLRLGFRLRWRRRSRSPRRCRRSCSSQSGRSRALLSSPDLSLSPIGSYSSPRSPRVPLL